MSDKYLRYYVVCSNGDIITRVVIYQKAGRDYPAELKGIKYYEDATKRLVSRRLELREGIDTVELIEE